MRRERAERRLPRHLSRALAPCRTWTATLHGANARGSLQRRRNSTAPCDVGCTAGLFPWQLAKAPARGKCDGQDSSAACAARWQAKAPAPGKATGQLPRPRCAGQLSGGQMRRPLAWALVSRPAARPSAKAAANGNLLPTIPGAATCQGHLPRRLLGRGQPPPHLYRQSSTAKARRRVSLPAAKRKPAANGRLTRRRSASVQVVGDARPAKAAPQRAHRRLRRPRSTWRVRAQRSHRRGSRARRIGAFPRR